MSGKLNAVQFCNEMCQDSTLKSAPRPFSYSKKGSESNEYFDISVSLNFAIKEKKNIIKTGQNRNLVTNVRYDKSKS